MCVLPLSLHSPLWGLGKWRLKSHCILNLVILTVLFFPSMMLVALRLFLRINDLLRWCCSSLDVLGTTCVHLAMQRSHAELEIKIKRHSWIFWATSFVLVKKKKDENAQVDIKIWTLFELFNFFYWFLFVVELYLVIQLTPGSAFRELF